MKRGYLGMLEGTYLAGRSAGHKQSLEEKGIILPEHSIPLDKMIYVTAFQGGMEKIITQLGKKTDQPIDKFISERILKPKDFNWEVFSSLMGLRSSDKDDSRGLMALSFMHDLIMAMENKASVINVSGIPSIEEVKRCFAPEVAQPICGILSYLKKNDETLPAPSQFIGRDNIERFKDLLDSNIYSGYSSAHKEIEFSTSAEAISEIRNKGADLLRAGKGVLLSRSVSMNVLSIAPKIIDVTFGKLPGTLAQVAGDLAAKFFESRRNIVIYQFKDWANEYSDASISHHINITADRSKS